MKKKILICGSSKNLGKYLANNFKKNSKVYSLSSSLKPNNNDIFNTDITKEHSLEKTFKEIKKKINSLDGIIFTVGNSTPTKGSLNDYKNSFNINFFSFVNLIETYLKVFKNKKIKIIVISSIAGVKTINAPTEYSVSKSALIYYSKIISKKLINKGVSINIISPGNILIKDNNWSKKIKSNKKRVLKYIKNHVPSNQFVQPIEIYKVCELIFSDKNINLIGSNIIIDGGQSL